MKKSRECAHTILYVFHPVSVLSGFLGCSQHNRPIADPAVIMGMQSKGRSAGPMPTKKPPLMLTMCPSAILVGRLHALLAELNTAEPQEHPASTSAPATVGDTAAIL